MKKKLLKIAEELGVNESLFIKSAMSFEDLAQHYRSADSGRLSILLRRTRTHSTRSTRIRNASSYRRTGSINRND